jgi:hypothetical protein
VKLRGVSDYDADHHRSNPPIGGTRLARCRERLGKAAQLIAPSDQARQGFTEVKLVIIDTAQRQERVIEHDDTTRVSDDTRAEPVMIEAKRAD